ncbi:putative cadmium/zinc-transporting ATPase HMA4 [Bidens hawaiensis]|uniref:putative cadmium/zinc-transporting ATPase HMA4 n=1 Tax=Bidens hawaiensis TaxID=980011 RepID=UPI00404AC2F0
MAAALVDYARANSVEPQPDNVEEFKDFPGEGIYGKIDGKDIYIGNQKIAIRAGCSQVPMNRGENNKGKSTGYIFVGPTPAGAFSLSDSCRIGVKEALEELKSMGIRTAMLTGDCEAAADYAQNQLGGALDMIHAGLLPQDKAKIIKEIQKESKTAMVGDGLNDAPALATADIGISMGVSGSALANETGHVILMSNDIRKIPVAVKLVRKARRKIFENIFIAIITKAAIIALAIAGHPLVWAAVLADVGTCLLVIFNSMLLLRGVTLRTVKTHSGSHNHAQCVSGTKVQKHGGCCGHGLEDNAQELKHLVQVNEETDSCCTHHDDHDNHVSEPDDNDDCCHDNHCTQDTKDECCADVTHDVSEGKQKHGCCADDDVEEIQEVKHVVQPQHACQTACKPKQETKCQETKCCNVTKDVESHCSGNSVNETINDNKPHCHLIEDTTKHENHHHHHNHNHHHHHHHHGLKKRHVSACCKSFISYRCCGAQSLRGGFNRKGYLSEIVIQ